ncbi:lycopene beta-cyclase CrtY [Stutzerimonas urumqiensis]|uniref:lycopene beta-cyclase CrtY n=1 Tax=Stutzerimonas urumqiensis TaxID=638269 RepID=UPI003DA3895C
MPPDVDLILVGGGLANGLLAWRLRQCRPDLRLLLLEQGTRLGGNHTWSFHEHDLTPAQRTWIEPLIETSWPGYQVRFPALTRRLGSGYASLTSSHFHRCLLGRLADVVRLDTAVVDIQPRQVRLACGRVVTGRAVLDGRGPRASRHLALGFQKFVGQEVRLAAAHGLVEPVIMDATVDQLDGYRFLYVLPLGPDRLLIEDTYYADGQSLPAEHLRARIADYAAARGWRIAEVLREEHGVLPIVLSGDPRAFWDEAGGVPQTGLAAALFHPTTGYSLPDAVRLADFLLACDCWEAAPLFEAIRDYSLRQWRRRGFYRLLNRMLFLAGRPEHRWQVMQRFYGLPQPLIQRFYAARSTLADRIRIVSGKPPVPVGEALRALVAHDLHRKDSR